MVPARDNISHVREKAREAGVVRRDRGTRGCGGRGLVPVQGGGAVPVPLK